MTRKGTLLFCSALSLFSISLVGLLWSIYRLNPLLIVASYLLCSYFWERVERMRPDVYDCIFGGKKTPPLYLFWPFFMVWYIKHRLRWGFFCEERFTVWYDTPSKYSVGLNTESKKFRTLEESKAFATIQARNMNNHCEVADRAHFEWNEDTGEWSVRTYSVTPDGTIKRTL